MTIKIVTQTHNYRNANGYNQSFTAMYAMKIGRQPILVLDDYSHGNMVYLLVKIFGGYEHFMCFEYDHKKHKDYKDYKELHNPMPPTAMDEIAIYNRLRYYKIITITRTKELTKAHNDMDMDMGMLEPSEYS